MKKLLPILTLPLFLLTACATTPTIRTAKQVDIDRFMGKWYVIGNMPTFIEKEAYNAVETYRLDDKGRVATTFSFRKGGFDGERKVYHPKGFIRDNESNAVWGMQFVWPVKAEYVIVYVNESYTQTIIGRSKRDYVWIMAREPQIPEKDYRFMLELLKKEGYDISKVRKVPQRWE
jgi:apolipoprotein D and lipocalin family protein